MSFKPVVQRMVKKHRAIIANCRLCKDDAVGVPLGQDYRELLAHANLNIACGVANFEEALVVRVGVLVGVDCGMGVGPLWEEVFSVHGYSTPPMGLILLSMYSISSVVRPYF